MIFWILATAMTLAVAVLIARPLLRKPDEDQESTLSAAEYDVEVFKSQLSEVEKELERGRLTAEEAEASRAEIGRRLLAADARRAEVANTQEVRTVSPRPLAGLAIATVVGCLAVAVVIYGDRGAPELPDMPLSLRSAEIQQAEADAQAAAAARTQMGEDGAAGNLNDMAGQLRARLEAGEGDASDWSLLGRTEMMRGNYAEAARAYERALEDFPQDSALNSAYGEALVFWADGQITDRAKATFDFVVQLTPGDARARFYLAEYDYQQALPRPALDRLIAMLSEARADAPWLGPVRTRAEQIAAELGLDAAEVLPPLPQVAEAPEVPAMNQPGPSEEDIAAAEDMSPEDRQAMIQGMVDGLAERLAADPSDFDGWVQLIRSRAVLGEMEAAQAALDEAAGHFANAPFPMNILTRLAAELELELPEGMAAAEPEQRGPTEEDIAAAQDMTQEEQAAMIQGMVGNLAARLEDNPNDLEGWTMLGRSYSVLGRLDEAADAYARASELNPEDTALTLEHARLLRALAGERQTEETVAMMRDIEAREPDNLEALWYLSLDALAREDTPSALDYLERAQAALPEGQPEFAQLASEIDRLLTTLE